MMEMVIKGLALRYLTLVDRLQDIPFNRHDSSKQPVEPIKKDLSEP